MHQATLQEEKKLWAKGYKYVACLDEAGRGPLAGPVVAGAAIIDPRRTDLRAFSRRSVLRGIKDSKQLSPKKREEFYKIIIKHPAIKWGIGIVSEKVIDKINILEATKLAMKKAVQNLEPKLSSPTALKIKRVVGLPEYRKIDFLILDGKMNLDLPILQKSIIKADEKIFSCAAASILAKVTRDRIMMRYHKKYPEYRFDLHKGYGTELHYRMLDRYGPCQIHRKSFNI